MNLGKPIVELKHVYFRYPGNSVHALEDISLSFNRGEFTAIIGENGSGKTTLFMIIVGLLKAERGQVKLSGEDISTFKNWHGIGYVPQRLQLSKHFPISVSDFVTLGLQSTKGLFSKINTLDKSRVRAALVEVGMEKYLDRKISDLSGGQFQRVLLARELVKNPKLILLDEPTIGVDIKHQQMFCCLLSKLNKRGITILIVTHDISFVSYHVGRVIGLNRSVIFDGKPDKLGVTVIKKLFGHATEYSNIGVHCKK